MQVFYDSFDDHFEGRWVVSQSSDYGGIAVFHGAPCQHSFDSPFLAIGDMVERPERAGSWWIAPLFFRSNHFWESSCPRIDVSIWNFAGKWKHEKSEGHDDYGLLVSEKAKKYGIAIDLPEKVDPKDGAVVLQYDLRLQNGLECGGAYLKFLQPQVYLWRIVLTVTCGAEPYMMLGT